MKIMKTVLAGLTAGVMCLAGTTMVSVASLIPMTASAVDTLTYGDVIYEYVRDGISVCGFDSEAKNVVIPSEIDGTAVVYWEYGWGDDIYPVLETVEVPSSITSICGSRFGGSVAVGDTSSMFDRFPKLKAVNVDADNERYVSDDGVLYEKQDDGTLWMRGYPPAKPDTSYTIPEAVTSVNENSLRKNLYLIDILTTENNTTYMSYDGVLYEWEDKYDYDENGQEVKTKQIVYAFCPSGKTSVTIPDVVTELRGNSYYPMTSDFSGCTALETVVIPDSVRSVEKSCFTGTKLRDSQAGSVVYADTWALGYDGDDGAELVIKDGTIGLADYIFGWNVHDGGMWGWLEQEGITEWGPKSVVLPDSLKYIGTGACAGCFSLESVNLPESLEEVGEEAFADCNKLSGNLVIPDGVTEIKEGVFSGCANLESVVIPESIEKIGQFAFIDCTSLTNVSIPGSVSKIISNPFLGCTGLMNINVDSDNENYASEEGILFNKDKSELICYPGGKEGAYEVPEGVTEIGWLSFKECVGLTSIKIPKSVADFDNTLFSGCTNLTSIQVDNHHESYASEDGVLFNKEKSALLCYPEGKKGNYKIPESVTEIYSWAFEGCAGLMTIAIPESVAMIGSSTFYDCISLTDVYYAGTEEQWNAIEIEYGNDPLTTATIHFNATAPATTMYGDVDENGEVNIMDVILLNRNLMVGAQVSAQGMVNADVDCNGTADAVDSLNILKYIVKLIPMFPV